MSRPNLKVLFWYDQDRSLTVAALTNSTDPRSELSAVSSFSKLFPFQPKSYPGKQSQIHCRSIQAVGTAHIAHPLALADCSRSFPNKNFFEIHLARTSRLRVSDN
jgi:hypothetical protein